MSIEVIGSNDCFVMVSVKVPVACTALGSVSVSNTYTKVPGLNTIGMTTPVTLTS